MRKLLVLVVVLSVIAGGAFVAAGFAAVPVIHINKPEKFVGAATPLDVLQDNHKLVATDAGDRI